MTNPVIKWRESFGYGSLVWNQLYIQSDYSTNSAYRGIAPADFGSLQQAGRGTGGDQGFAMVGNPGAFAGLRATTLGFSGAIDTNAVSNNKVGVAFAYQQGGHVGGSILCEFIDDDGLGNGSFSLALMHLSVQTLPDGRICVRNGTGSGGGNLGTVIGISTFVMPVGAASSNGNYTHIEITQPVIHSTNGSIQVYADGALVLNLSGVPTRNSLLGSGKIGYVQPRATDGRYITDLIIHDCSGSGRIGDKRVSYRKALSAGTHTAGVASNGGTLLSCVSEQAADGDTTYIQFTNTGLPKAASFVCQAMPADAVTIDEVTEHVIVRKTDASADTGRQEMKSGATLVDNGTDVSTPSGYNVLTLVGPAPGHQVDPNTSAAWTVGNCDAVEVGYRRTA